MNKLIKTAIFVMAIMMSSNFAFGQEELLNSSTPTNPTAIATVSIPEGGYNCPINGTVTSEWKWENNSYGTIWWVPGTSASYVAPATVTVESIRPNGNVSFKEEVRVTARPKDHPEGNKIVVGNTSNPNPIVVIPGPCDGGTPNNPHDNTTE
jgi:hypothetical protein